MSDFSGQVALITGGARGMGRCVSAKLSTTDRPALGNVETPMTINDFLFATMRPDLEKPARADVESVFAALHLQNVPFLSPSEITRAVLFLAHPDSSHITGTVLPIDAGATARLSS